MAAMMLSVLGCKKEAAKPASTASEVRTANAHLLANIQPFLTLEGENRTSATLDFSMITTEM